MEKIIFNTIRSNRIEILLKIRENFESMQLGRQLFPNRRSLEACTLKRNFVSFISIQLSFLKISSFEEKSNFSSSRH